MIQELMSLEAIETWLHDVNNLNGDYYRMEILHVKEMLKTARAAHELQAKNEILSQALLESDSNCNNALNDMQQEIDQLKELLTKARSEERERCAKLCEDYKYGEGCIEAIRALKDA